MRPGDKVRMLRGIEEGHITRIINDKLVEIETTDGFPMPVLKTDLVLVASEESDYFDKPQKTIEAISTPKAAQPGVFIVFEQEDGKKVAEVFFINNTDFSYMTVASEVASNGLYETKINNFCEAFTSLKIGNYHLDQFEKWPSIAFHLTKLDKKGKSEPEFTKRIFTAKAKNFFKNKTSSPLRHNPAYVFNLLEGSVRIDSAKLKEQLTEYQEETIIVKNPHSPIREVDLHIERLREDFEFLKPEEILPIQMALFEKELDSAIMNNCSEITFIHGVGSGKLKYEISKILSKHPHVKYYQDADKQKFGYGATKAFFG